MFTGKLLCSVAAVALLAVPASASALDTGLTYDASIVTTAPQPVGAIVFQSSPSGGASTCRYLYRWTSVTGGRAVGFVDEARIPTSNDQCSTNALESFTTTVLLARTAPAQGFDQLGRRQQVLSLVLGEADDGEISGVVELTGAVPTVYSLDLSPR